MGYNLWMLAIDIEETIGLYFSDRAQQFIDRNDVATSRNAIIEDLPLLLTTCMQLADYIVFDGVRYTTTGDLFIVVNIKPNTDDPIIGELQIAVCDEIPDGIGRDLLGGKRLWIGEN